MTEARQHIKDKRSRELDTSAPTALNAITAIQPGKALVHRDAGEAFFAELTPGHRLRATVQNLLPNGEFVVMLGAFAGRDGHEVQVKLPAGFRPGDMINLIFVSREPRPAFMLAPDVPQPAGNSASLSGTGRFIHDLMQHPPLPGSSTALSSTVPLLAAPPSDAAQLLQLAQGLARAMARSGLFYESHQAQWITGKRPLAELMLEPQARLAPLPELPFASNGSPLSVEARDPSASQKDSVRLPGVHPEAVALVRQQLEVFETRHIGWQGELWPGQRLAWEAVEEKPGESGERDPGSGPVWKTRLNLSLPNLGPITASLRLDSGGVDVQLTVKEPGTASIMRTGAVPLMHGLESAGLRLVSMGVDVDDKTPSA